MLCFPEIIIENRYFIKKKKKGYLPKLFYNDNKYSVEHKHFTKHNIFRININYDKNCIDTQKNEISLQGFLYN